MEECYRLNVCLPPNLYVEMLTPIVMILGGGASGKLLSHEGEVLTSRISALIKGTPERFLALSLPPREDTARRQPFVN